MRKIVVSEFVSLDGVMQAPGGKDEDTEGGFVHGGWTLPYWHDDIMEHFTKRVSNKGGGVVGWGYEHTTSLPHRCYRRRMASAGALGSRGQDRRPSGLLCPS